MQLLIAMRANVSIIIFMLFFIGTFYAGTVTLTGTCKNALQPGNAIAFGIANSGNDTAYNLVIVPRVIGAVPANSSFRIASLGPNSNYSIAIHLDNVTGIGSFVDSILVSYQQGNLFVTDLFPCYVNMGNVSALSSIYLSATVHSKANEATINVSAYNAGMQPVTANISLLLPPSFKFLTNTYFIANVAPYSASNFTFVVQPEKGVSYAGGAVASAYVINGIRYSSIALITVEAAPPSAINPFYVFSIAISIIVIAIILLLVRAIYKKRKHKRR